jgi:hypothetical protein
MTFEKTVILTKQTAGDPFSAYASAMKARTIDGELLKFSKGDYFAGLDDKPVPIGTRLVAIMDRLKIGFIRWSNNAPGDHIMGFVADNFNPPRRSELGDLDKTLWDTDNNGVPRDPWQFTNHLPFASPYDHSCIYTFATASRGGLKAIGELCREHGRNNRQGCLPVVLLQVDSYLHHEKTYGRIKVPVFKIVGYVEKAFMSHCSIMHQTAPTNRSK